MSCLGLNTYLLILSTLNSHNSLIYHNVLKKELSLTKAKSSTYLLVQHKYLFHFVLFFESVSLCSSGRPGTQDIDQADFELIESLLPLPSKFCD